MRQVMGELVFDYCDEMAISEHLAELFQDRGVQRVEFSPSKGITVTLNEPMPILGRNIHVGYIEDFAWLCEVEEV